MNVIERIPIGIGLLLKSFDLIGCHCQCRILFYPVMGMLLLHFVPFHVVPKTDQMTTEEFNENVVGKNYFLFVYTLPCVVSVNIIAIGEVPIAKLLSSSRWTFHCAEMISSLICHLILHCKLLKFDQNHNVLRFIYTFLLQFWGYAPTEFTIQSKQSLKTIYFLNFQLWHSALFCIISFKHPHFVYFTVFKPQRLKFEFKFATFN